MLCTLPLGVLKQAIAQNSQVHKNDKTFEIFQTRINVHCKLDFLLKISFHFEVTANYITKCDIRLILYKYNIQCLKQMRLEFHYVQKSALPVSYLSAHVIVCHFAIPRLVA